MMMALTTSELEISNSNTCTFRGLPYITSALRGGGGSENTPILGENSTSNSDKGGRGGGMSYMEAPLNSVTISDYPVSKE